MDYTYHHQYNMYPEYYTPQYAQQYPPVSDWMVALIHLHRFDFLLSPTRYRFSFFLSFFPPVLFLRLFYRFHVIVSVFSSSICPFLLYFLLLFLLFSSSTHVSRSSYVSVSVCSKNVCVYVCVCAVSYTHLRAHET